MLLLLLTWPAWAAMVCLRHRVTQQENCCRCVFVCVCVCGGGGVSVAGGWKQGEVCASVVSRREDIGCATFFHAQIRPFDSWFQFR